MNARPPDGSDEPDPVDPVMLSVLANRGRNAAVLTGDEERLLDAWVTGDLGPDDAERAATLAKRNVLAAERVLERRLLQAAAQSPPIPQAVTDRILASASAAAAPATAPGTQRRLFGRWRWVGLIAAAALAAILIVVAGPVLYRLQEGTALQVAMVTIADRRPLFESSDIRMRGAPAPTPAEQRFRDVEMPAELLRTLLDSTGTLRADAHRQIESYLPGIRDTGGRPLRIMVDTALRDRLAGSDRQAPVAVRIYDLADPRTADIRGIVGPSSDRARVYLLTIRP
jgi:hypothetical protein